MTIDIKASTTTQQVLSLASKNQDLLRQVSIQIASGNKHTDFKGFAEDGTVERLISFKENIAAAQTFKTSNNIVISKMNKDYDFPQLYIFNNWYSFDNCDEILQIISSKK